MSVRGLNVLTLLLFLVLTAFGQHDHFSEDDIMTTDGFRKAYPHLADQAEQKQKELDQFTKEYIANEQIHGSRAGSDYIIPVVFHVLHENGVENISNAVIHDAMRILNEDFNRKNPDTADVVTAFKNTIGNPKIEFRLAKKDPQGNSHSGIDRIYTNLTNNAGEGSKLNVWPRSTYLNVWIVKTIGSGAAGYTFLPGTAHFMGSRDGIILLYNYFGAVRSGSSRLSRALTHEIGHWLNLPHTWGGTNNPGISSNCQDDDGVWDTPNTVGYRSCNLNGTSCGSLDNVQNYMDYSYCSMMFTNGQASRMRAALASGTAERNKLVSYTNNKAAGVLDINEVLISSTNRTICAGESVQFTDESYYDITEWNWEFKGANISSSTSKSPTVSFDKPGVYNVKLTVKQADGSSKTKTFSNYIRVNQTVGNWLPYTEQFDEKITIGSQNWIAQDEDSDGNTWKLDVGGNGFSNPGYLRLDNFSNVYFQEESVTSPTIDVSNIVNPKLSFYVSTAGKNVVSNDNLRVLVSKDCGMSWEMRYNGVSVNLADGKTSNSAFFPTKSSDWKLVTLNTFSAGDKVENLMIRFEVVNGGGNNFFIDDINITGSYEDSPSLRFPRNGMDSVSQNVTLDWRSVPFSNNYEYQLATDPGFSNITSQGTTVYLTSDPNGKDSEFETKSLTPGNNYYWRVRSTRGSLISNWSDVWNFTVSSTGIGHEYLDGEPKGDLTGVQALQREFSSRFIPNPTQGNTALEINVMSDSEVTIRVLSLDGQLVWSNELLINQGVNRVTIPSIEFQKGLYLVSLNSLEFRATSKLIVQ